MKQKNCYLHAATILLFAIFLFAACFSGMPVCLAFRNIQQGDAASDFLLKDLDGKPHSLYRSKGKVIIMLYWRFGQKRSHKALEDLKSINEKFSNQPLQIFAVTKDTDKLSEIKKLSSSLQLPFPVLLDSKAKIYADYGVFVFPSTAMIDKKGILSLYYGGLRDNYHDELYGETRILLGLITREALQAETAKTKPDITEEQKKAINHINLGKTLQKRGMDDKAMQEFKRAVVLDPDNPEGHILLGFELLYKKQADPALNHFQKAIKLDPRSTDAKIGMGSAYRMKGQTDKALEILQSGLGLCPDSATLHMELGKIFESLKKYQDAMKHYKSSAECSLNWKNRSSKLKSQ